MLIGCARVSMNEQDTTEQASALKAAGCERIFREKATLRGFSNAALHLSTTDRLRLIYSPAARKPRIPIGRDRELALVQRISAPPHSSSSEAA